LSRGPEGDQPRGADEGEERMPAGSHNPVMINRLIRGGQGHTALAGGRLFGSREKLLATP
jgi:hypothetical protein